MPSLPSCGRLRVRKRSIPGLASPIEFSIPTSVSAMRTGVLPSLGSDVTVFVTNASRLRATSGAVSASRHPEALSSTKHRAVDTQTLELAVDLDRAPVTRSVAAGHRRLPGQLSGGNELTDGGEHRLGPAREHVQPRRNELRHERRLDADLGVRHELGRLRVPVRAEAEDRRRPPERLRQVRQGRDPDAATDEERSLDLEAEAVAERAEDVELLSRLECRQCARAGADRVDEERELARRRKTEAHGSRQQAPRRLEHEELPRDAGIEPAP